MQANETRCLLDREPCRLFILRGPKCLTPHVDLSSHKYPKNGLLADFVWGFQVDPKSPFEGHKEIHLLGPRIKYCLVVRWDSMSTKRPMHVILCEALLLTGTPKGVTKLAFIYVKRPWLKHCHIAPGGYVGDVCERRWHVGPMSACTGS